MADIVARLRAYAADDHERGCQGREYTCACGYDDKRDPLLAEAADTITALRAENARLRAALAESADELDAYYLMQYPGDHPYNKAKLAQALASNPARAAIQETSDKPAFTTGHCEHKKAPGGCQLHNLQCGYPDCDRRPA